MLGKPPKKLHTFCELPKKTENPRPLPLFHKNFTFWRQKSVLRFTHQNLADPSALSSHKVRSFFLHFFGDLPIMRIANFYLVSTGNSSSGNILYEEELQDNLERKNKNILFSFLNIIFNISYHFKKNILHFLCNLGSGSRVTKYFALCQY